MGFLSGKPTSNEPKKDSSENPWGSQNSCVDDVAVLLNDMGKRCSVCKRVVLNKYLTSVEDVYYCPDHKPETVVHSV